MRLSSKPLLLGTLGTALVISLAAFGYDTGVQAQVAAPTGSATMSATTSSTSAPSGGATTAASATSMNTTTGGGASGTGSTGSNTTVYPPCPANSASGAATLTGQSTAGVTTGTGTAMPQATMGASATAMSQATMAATVSSAAGTTSGAGANPTASGSGTAYLGISAAGIDNCGMSIVGLIPGGPALAAGLQVGDVIVAVGGQSIASIYTNFNSAATGASSTGTTNTSGNASATMAATMNAGAGGATAVATTTASLTTKPFFTFIETNYQPGQSVTVTIERRGQQMDVQVTLGAIPAGLVTGTPGGATGASTTVPAAGPSPTP